MVFLCQKLKARFGQDFQPFGAGANRFIYGSSSGSGSTTNPNYGSGSDSGSEKNAWLRGSELRLRLRLPSPAYNSALLQTSRGSYRMPAVGTCSNYRSKMTRLFETAVMPHSGKTGNCFPPKNSIQESTLI